MTEDQARQLTWLLARENEPRSGAWSADDSAWATRQALSTLATPGESASREAFVQARTALAMGRLLPRDEEGRRFVARRIWHAAWVPVVMLVSFLLGGLVDQLGPPLRVSLLAPAVWAVVAWNLLVYALMLWPQRESLTHQRLMAWIDSRTPGATVEWFRHAAPLTWQRLLLVMHAAAVAFALGLMAGLYLRGLVLDYRIGWQSTFLGPAAVQALLDVLLAPAAFVTGIPVADVAPLRMAPGAEASASAAAWIHLFAATLALFVVVPRGLLCAAAALRAKRLAQAFPMPLDLPGLRRWHALMRPDAVRALRLLWLAPADLAACELLGTRIERPASALPLWRSPEGDALELVPLPAELRPGVVVEHAPSRLPRWWPQSLGRSDPQAQALRTLAQRIDGVLRVVKADDEPAPAWLSPLGRPVITLRDAAIAPPPQLPLRSLADGWLADGALLQALRGAWPDDDRFERLQQAWVAMQAAKLSTAIDDVAQRFARLACAREPVADDGFLGRKDDGSAARAALARQLDAEWRAGAEHMAALLGARDAVFTAAAPVAQPTVHGRVAEGRAAMLGGVVSGALAGLKADLLSGGMTMGAGAVAGGVLGALGAAGAARGLNAARGTERSHAAWGDDAMPALALALLSPYLQFTQGMNADAAALALRPALAAQQAALSAAWNLRPKAAAVAEAAAPVLERVVKHALGGP